MKFRLIEDQREAFPVRVMCDVMGVSAAGYYAWRGRPESPRKAANRALLTEIRRVHLAHRGRYGVPRIHAALRSLGHTANRERRYPVASCRFSFVLGWPSEIGPGSAPRCLVSSVLFPLLHARIAQIFTRSYHAIRRLFASSRMTSVAFSAII